MLATQAPRPHRAHLRPQVVDTDPMTGGLYTKRSWFEGGTLHTVARDTEGKRSDFVTTRTINSEGSLIQTNEHGGHSFERVFERKIHRA